MTQPEIVCITPMTINDVPRVVQIHQAAFSGFFLTFLGPRFLRLLYGEAVSLGEIALVAKVDGEVVGMVMGSVQPGGFYGNLLRRRLLAFGVAAAPAVFRRPSVAARLGKALLKPRMAAKPEGTATLMSVAVLPAGQGHGAGRELVTRFVAEARRRGALLIDLATDRDNNEGANWFYLGVGFRLAGESVTAEGRALNEYELDLSER